VLRRREQKPASTIHCARHVCRVNSRFFCAAVHDHGSTASNKEIQHAQLHPATPGTTFMNAVRQRSARRTTKLESEAAEAIERSGDAGNGVEFPGLTRQPTKLARQRHN
jgi:hypothetical protein